MSIKIDIISGFLGAGKTTLIKKLLENGFNHEKLVLIENEFGEIGIDGTFLKESGVNIKEINSGCICCSLVGDFTKSMSEVIERFNPERIIIEPSGVGKLSDIVSAVLKLDLDIKLNIVTTVVDGSKCKIYMKNFGEFFNNQVEDANTIIVSKTEKLTDEKKEEVLQLLKEKNPNANILFVNLPTVEGKKLFELLEKHSSITKELEERLKNAHHHHHDDDDDEHECCHHHHDDDDDEHECCHHHHDDDDDDEHECCHHHHHGHDADEVFTSYGFETTKSYTYNELEEILKALNNETLYGVVLRAKGLLSASDNENWYYFDYVAGDYQINEGNSDFMGRFVVIGSKLNQENLEKLILKK